MILAYTNIPVLKEMVELEKVEYPLSVVQHRRAGSAMSPELIQRPPRWTFPIDHIAKPWEEFRKELKLPEGALPSDAHRSAMLSYWVLARSDVMVVHLDDGDPSILVMLPVAGVAGIPVIGVSSMFSFDPVLCSLLDSIVKPSREVITNAMNAATLNRRRAVSSTQEA